MQRALVTGGSGFIVRHLAQSLVGRGIDVSCFVRPSSETAHLSSLGVQVVTGDLTNFEDMRRAVESVDVVFHAAGLTHGASPTDLDRINGACCGVLADACRNVPDPPRIIYVSSLAAAGPAASRTGLLTEADSPKPISDYGRSKRLGEIELQKRAGDVPVTVIRPGIVLGPYDLGTISIIKSIYNIRVHMVVGFRTPRMSLIYIDDLIDLLWAAANKGERLTGDSSGEYSPSGYYFACNDSEFPTYLNVGLRYARSLDRWITPFWAVKPLAMMVAGISQFTSRMRGRTSLLSIDKVREAAAVCWAASAEKARRELGFEPSVDLDDAIQRTVDWYLENVKGRPRKNSKDAMSVVEE